MFTLTVKEPKSNPDNRYIAIKMPTELADKIDELATATNRTRGDIINTLLTHTVEHVQVTPNEKKK